MMVQYLVSMLGQSKSSTKVHKLVQMSGMMKELMMVHSKRNITEGRKSKNNFPYQTKLSEHTARLLCCTQSLYLEASKLKTERVASLAVLLCVSELQEEVKRLTSDGISGEGVI